MHNEKVSSGDFLKKILGLETTGVFGQSMWLGRETLTANYAMSHLCISPWSIIIIIIP